MKEYFKTDDKQFAFRPKKASPLSLMRPIKLNLIGELDFLDEYRQLVRIDEDNFLFADVNACFRGYTQEQKYPLAILNIKDNTLKGIDLKRSTRTGFRLSFCIFKGKLETFISFAGESKIFLIKDLTVVKVLDGYTVYSDSDSDYGYCGFNGALKSAFDYGSCYIFDGEKLSYSSNDRLGGGIALIIPGSTFEGAIPPHILGDGDLLRKRSGNLLARLIQSSTPTFSGKAVFLKKDELCIVPIFQDDVIEIKEQE